MASSFFFILLFFSFMCAFVSGLLSNTVINVYVVKAMTNNKPQVWISGNKLLVFWVFTLQSSQMFTKCVFSLYYVILFLYT